MGTATLPYLSGANGRPIHAAFGAVLRRLALGGTKGSAPPRAPRAQAERACPCGRVAAPSGLKNKKAVNRACRAVVGASACCFLPNGDYGKTHRRRLDVVLHHSSQATGEGGSSGGDEDGYRSGWMTGSVCGRRGCSGPRRRSFHAWSLCGAPATNFKCRAVLFCSATPVPYRLLLRP